MRIPQRTDQTEAQEQRGATAGTEQALTGRRTVLAVGAAGAAALTLAACGSGSSGGSGSGGSGSGGSGSGGSGSGGGAGGAAAGGGGTTLAQLSSIPVGGCVSAQEADGKPVIVSRPTADKAVAFSAICTHMGCTVAPDGKALTCPCHGSQYDAATGAVLRGPAPKPLPAIPVHVTNGSVVTGNA